MQDEKSKVLKPVQIEAAKAMLANHMNWRQIGECFGVHAETVRRALDEKYRIRRTEQVNKRRHMMRAYQQVGLEPASVGWCADRRRVRDDAADRIAEIPLDTRGLTARTFGDPLPGRSALDRRSAREVR